jgi:hypothetical protein
VGGAGAGQVEGALEERERAGEGGAVHLRVCVCVCVCVCVVCLILGMYLVGGERVGVRGGNCCRQARRSIEVDAKRRGGWNESFEKKRTSLTSTM